MASDMKSLSFDRAVTRRVFFFAPHAFMAKARKVGWQAGEQRESISWSTMSSSPHQVHSAEHIRCIKNLDGTYNFYCSFTSLRPYRFPSLRMESDIIIRREHFSSVAVVVGSCSNAQRGDGVEPSGECLIALWALSGWEKENIRLSQDSLSWVRELVSS